MVGNTIKCVMVALALWGAFDIGYRVYKARNDGSTFGSLMQQGLR